MDVYANPDNTFVAGFIGSPRMNLLAAEVTAVSDRAVSVTFAGMAGEPVPVPVRNADLRPGVAVTLGLRPEQLIAGGTGESAIKARVEFVEHLGGTSFAYAPSFPSGPLIVASDPRRGSLQRQEEHVFRFHGADCLLFDGTGLRIR